MTKTILGLDLGTNSIGWALVNQEDKKILGMGSRIVPMSQDIIGEFEKGNKVSQTATRTSLRMTRRLKERHLLRRARLHRVLASLNFLPSHFIEDLDEYGNIKAEREPKLAYFKNQLGKHQFIFETAFLEMVEAFKKNGQLDAKIPHDWTIYYLRQKALTEKLTKEELAWLLLHFNQKRGYYQLRGEDDEINLNKSEDFYNLKVIKVEEADKGKKAGEIWYNVILENGWIYRRSSKISLKDWEGKNRDFIITTDLNDDGSIKTDKDGKEKRSFRAPKDDDWGLLKKKTESEIIESKKTVGQYIFDALLKNQTQKIKGKLVRTIERKFYKEEVERILETQIQFHPELQSKTNYAKAIESLYKSNEQYRNSIQSKDFKYLFVNDIIFYQRPLKSKKSLISNCSFEFYKYVDKDGVNGTKPIKCISTSHPLFQEFRLWQWIQNLRIYQLEKEVNGKLETDIEVTNEFITDINSFVVLFDFLNDRKEVDQKAVLKFFLEQKGLKGKPLLLKIEKYRWNFVADKIYPCNETRSNILKRFEKVDNTPANFLTTENEIALWHILYSVRDKIEIEKALNSFATKHNLDTTTFVDNFKKYPLIKSDYGAYSEKAIKKLLPLIRLGKYWIKENIHPQTLERIEKIINREFDEKIKNRVREKAIKLNSVEHFQGLPLWITSYVVYDRHSETSENKRWTSIQDFENYIKEFKQHSLRNPIVEQVLTETLRTVKDIWTKYGNGMDSFFEEIHIELGRDMKNNAKDRKEISERNAINEATNLRVRKLLEEFSKPEYAIDNVRPFSPSQAEILKIYEDGVLNSGIEIDEDIQKISKSPQPSSKEIMRYKLWMEQKYKSPYTGDIIPLSKLFTSVYEIEHIIPQSIYFDDSFSNKVICESEVNKLKSNQFGYEFINNHGGEIVECGYGKKVKVLKIDEYENLVKLNYAKSKGKMKKLLLEDVPEKMVERQLNDTRYISKEIKNLLSNLVRTERDDDGVTSKNILSSNGSITSILKQDWGLNDVWNSLITPRFERMNKLTDSNQFGYWDNKEGKQVFQIQMPLELQKGFNKKRIDHRHHALDALIIALANRNHVNYLNNQSALAKNKTKIDKQKDRIDLRTILCDKVITDDKGNYKWRYKKPWETITQDAKNELDKIIISFKQNLRVINKTVNYYQKFEDGKKQFVKQTKGDNWAIRKALHKDTVAGLVSLQKTKEASLSTAIDDVLNIKLKSLRKQIQKLQSEGLDKKKINQFFKDLSHIWEGKNIAKVEVFYFENEMVASRSNFDDSFNRKKIESITDTGIQNILINHLSRFDETEGKKLTEHPELAFSPEGIEDMNKNINALNNGKNHHAILKVRTYEPKGNKFIVGATGNKKDKYVEAAKGTNLYFAIYIDKEGNRSYDTIGFNIVAERLKQGLLPVPEKENCTLLFWLSPNDLVYVPNEEEKDNPNLVDCINLKKEQVERIYVVNDFSGVTCYFVPNQYSKAIAPKEIDTSFDLKTAKDSFKKSIKDKCWKLEIDRLGNIKKAIK